MSEANTSLYELLNLSIGTPQEGAVNFSALHALLHAVLRQLDIREMETGWRDPAAPEQDHHPESPSPSSGSRWGIRIQTCEDGLSKAMTLIQELRAQRDDLREEMTELRRQKHMVDAKAEMVTALEKCCHRVDALEETVRSLLESAQRYPEELGECVTWGAMGAALLGDRGTRQKEFVHSGIVDPATNTPFTNNLSSHPSTPCSPHPVEDTGSPAAPRSPSMSGQSLTDQEVSRRATAALSVQPETYQETHSEADGTRLSRKGSERHPETLDALRDIGRLKEKHEELEARVATLEDGRTEQSQLTELRELVTNKGSQHVSSSLTDQMNQQAALMEGLMREQEKGAELANGVQKMMLQLQAECERLQERSRRLQEDGRRRQSLMEKLHKMTEELEAKKADKQMVESELKADESKVSRLQFDSVTEQLSAMFHELLSRVAGQEQDWQQVTDRLSADMECKLNRMELDSVKTQLEGRWKSLQERLQAQGTPEHEDAAALRKQLVDRQLVDRFHCLSCDRPVVKHGAGPPVVTLPSTPGFPAHKSIRPFTVYALEQFRQHYRSERLSEPADYSHVTVTRSCGGSHTVTPAGQRRSGLQPAKHRAEVDGATQSEEIDIIGLDGHIYKGRLNAPVTRTTETKLPTISTRDGSSKAKDRNKPYRPAASPEAGLGAPHPNSAKSAQCSRSASSSSGRDWPVSALGCASQSAIAQASAAAGSDAAASQTASQ